MTESRPPMVTETPRQLSSRATLIFKFLLPPMCFATVLSEMHRPAGSTIAIIGLFLLIATFLMVTIVFVPLKRVRLFGGKLLVSNYLSEIEVPLRDVENVSGFPYSAIIKVRLRTPTRYGRKIRFLGPMQWIRQSRHPAVAELRNLIFLVTPRPENKVASP